MRPLLVVAAAALAIVAAATSLAPSGDRPASRAPASIAERLGERTWAFAIPTSWLTAPLPGLRDDDILDLLGTRVGERAAPIASGLRVLSSDERAVVVELTADDAAAIASARARGLSLVPILRSLR
ncbi:MAG: hypothetical protein KGN00_02255 [Chloroflexota bacterium]|nr:hypothetical protein [Chloroflexota bacterium]